MVWNKLKQTVGYLATILLYSKLPKSNVQERGTILQNDFNAMSPVSKNIIMLMVGHASGARQ